MTLNLWNQIETIAADWQLLRELAGRQKGIVSAHIEKAVPQIAHLSNRREIELMAGPRDGTRIDYSGHSGLGILAATHQHSLPPSAGCNSTSASAQPQGQPISSKDWAFCASGDPIGARTNTVSVTGSQIMALNRVETRLGHSDRVTGTIRDEEGSQIAGRTVLTHLGTLEETSQ